MTPDELLEKIELLNKQNSKRRFYLHIVSLHPVDNARWSAQLRVEDATKTFNYLGPAHGETLEDALDSLASLIAISLPFYIREDTLC